MLTVLSYIDEIQDDATKMAIEKVRLSIIEGLDNQVEETIQYGMIGYVIPKSIYPDGYHCDTSQPLPFAGLARRKNSISLYHMGLYADTELLSWWQGAYSKHCKYKLDMGKSCIRFKKFDDIPYALITELFRKMNSKQWINLYETNLKK